MVAPSPTYEEVVQESVEIAKQFSEHVTYQEIGLSEKGRPLPLMILTNPKLDNKNKKVLLLTGGVDGDEEVGRAVNIAFAKWLLKSENVHYLDSQVILIAPCCNPDGAVDNLPNKMGNGTGFHPSQLYVPGKEPATPEAKAMMKLVQEWIPDCCIDYHGLAGGGMGENMFLYSTVNDKYSRPLLFDVARQLCDVCAAAGFTIDGGPKLHVEPRWNLPGWLAKNYSTFSMILEGTENYYPIEDSIQSGLIRLQKLLEISEEKRKFHLYENYPCDLICGNFMGAIFPYGENYQERRESRKDISQMIMEGVPTFGRKACDHNWEAVVHLPLTEKVKTLPKGLVFRATIDKRASIKGVLWNGNQIEKNKWKIENFDMGQVVTAVIDGSPNIGENELVITYDVPFKRHVTVEKKN